MECPEIIKLIPLFLDDAVEGDQRTDIQVHLSSCPNCQNELRAFRRSWDALKQGPVLEPDPDYVSRFWTNLSARTPLHRKAWGLLDRFVLVPRLVPVWATAFVLIVVSVFVVRNYSQIQETEMVLTSLPAEEVELIDNIELAENYDVIRQLDILEDMDAVETWDSQES